MNFKLFARQAAHRIEPHLKQRGYVVTPYPGLKASIIFRKVITPWFVFISFQYNHRSLPTLGKFDVHTARLTVDKPYGQYIRDQNGIYIPGSLVGGVSAPNGAGWFYTTPDELALALDTILPGLMQEIERLENLQSTMDYT